jgi:hypothetical protein
MPSLPESPVSPIPGLPVLAGLICGHVNCETLFSDLEDALSHAQLRHAGTVLADTCSIQELENESGSKELVLVRDDLEKTGKLT